MSSHYHLTASFSSLSTDPKAREALSLEDATAKAKANLRYVCRKSATRTEIGGAVVLRVDGKTMGMPDDDAGKKRFLSMLDARLEDRASKHRKGRGVRLLDKAIVSLPADATPEQQLEIATAIIEDLAGESSATALAALHADKPRNPHLHLWLIDGLETPEAAQARASERREAVEGDAFLDGRPTKRTRVRRQDHLRLGELKGRATARLRVAGVINRIGSRYGLRHAETRSLEELGEARSPQKHEGVQVADRGGRSRRSKLTGRLRSAVAHNANLIMNSAPLKAGFINLEALPERLRPWLKSEIVFGNQRIAENRAARRAMKKKSAPAPSPKVPEPAPISEGPPPGWVPPLDPEADAEFDRLEAIRLAAKAKAEKDQKPQPWQRVKVKTRQRVRVRGS